MDIYPFFRSLLFRLNPEQAHGLTLNLIRLAGSIPPVRSVLQKQFQPPDHPVQVLGLTFKNPIGLAAGYDKDAVAWRGLASLGFGHIEVGTVTLRPQPGNPKPRLFRLPAEQAVINRMGFPGKGSVYAALRLVDERPPGLVLGVNIGKNKDTPLEMAEYDYLALLQIFAPLADYLALNISSPNTVGLRRLQERANLERLLGAVAQKRAEEQVKLNKHIPILVKLAPDLSDDALDDALAAILQSGMDGVIASNTTLSREGLNSPLAAEAGGLSGAPLRALSTQMVRKIADRTSGRLAIIGVGGVGDVASAKEKLDAGASLVQLYTGLIYQGPGLVKQICRELVQ